jgi:hypothetical protein
MLDTFEFRNHVCMVFPRYAASVYDFLRDNLFYPFPLHQVRDIAHQLLLALDCTVPSNNRDRALAGRLTPAHT